VHGLGLRGDAGGGAGGETVRIGIGPPGRGSRPGVFGDSGVLLGGKERPSPAVDPEPPVMTCGSGHVGCLDKELIRRVIHQHRNEIRYCYELQLTRNPQLQGKASVKFVVAATGTVSASEVVDSTVRSPQLEGCVAGRVRTWRFPAIPNGGSAVVTYPFVFRSTGP
jgi:TonB family protein